MLRNISKPVVQKLFYWTPLLALFVVLACDSGTDSKSSNTLSTRAPTGLVLEGEDGSSAANAIAVSGSALYEGTSLDLNTLVQNAKGDLSFFTVDSSGTETAITDPTTYKLPNEAVTIRIRAAGNGDYNSKSLYFSITLTAKGSSSFAKNGAPSGFDFDGSAGTFADPILVTSDDPIGTFNLANLVTGGIGLSYASVVDDNGSEGTAAPIPAADVATYAPGAGEVIIKITDAGDASTVAAAAPLYFKITFVAAQANNLALQAASGNYTIATTGTNDNGDTTDGSTFALAAAVTNTTTITTATAIDFSSFTTGNGDRTLSYAIVANAADAADLTQGTPIPLTGMNNASAYTHGTAGTIVVRIYDPGSNMVVAKSLFVSVVVAIADSGFAFGTPATGYTLGAANDGLTFAAPKVVTKTGGITTATAIDFSSLTTGEAGTLSYDIVSDATTVVSNITDGTDYTPAAAGTIVVRISDPGTTDVVAAKSLFVSVVVAIADSGFAFGTPATGYTLGAANDGLTFAAPKVVTKTGGITTATAIDFSSLTTGEAGTLSYDIVSDATTVVSNITDGTDYTPAAAGTIVVRISDPGTTDVVAAKSLFVSVEVAAQANNLALQATSGNYTIATTGTNADSDTTDGSTFAQAAAVTNSTPITTATAINFTGFTSTSAGTLVYHIVTSAQASDPTLGTSISSPYTHNTAGTIVVRIYDPGTTSVAAKSLFVSVEVAAQANNLALQATSGNYTIATTGTNADSDTTDGSTFAQAAAVTNSTPITTATAINFTGFTSTSAGTLVYHIVTSAQASDPTLGTSISSPYTHNTAGTIVVRIYDPGTTSVAAKSLFVSVEVAAQANNLALQATSGNYTIATTGTNADSDTTDGSTFAQAAAVTNSTPITTATAINFTGFTSTSAGTLVYHIVTSAQASDPTLGTSISSPYTHNTAGTIVVRIYDPGTTSVAAKSLFVSVEVAAQANNLALQATSGNYTIATTGTNADSDTTDGSTFAQAAAVTNSTPITTATAINFTGFTSTSAGTLVYHIVTSAQASDPTLGTSISSPYTHNTAGTIVVRIYDPGTTSVAAKSLFVSVEVAAQANNLALQATSGNYTIATTGTNADSDTTDGSTFAQAAAVTNSTPITTATAINFTGFTSTSAGTLVYHIVTSAQASDPTLGTSISSPYTHNTAGTIVVRIYDPGTTSVAAKSLFVSVEVAAQANNLALQATSGNYTIATTGTNADSDTTDGSTFAQAAAVTNSTPITTATAINFTGFTSTSAGTLVYHIVTSAQASDPTLGTSISSPYTHNTAGTIVVRIYDPGTTSVAAKSLFVSVEVAAQANNLALQATSGNYTIATTGTNADSDTTDGSTFAQAAAVTNSTPITTATAINFTGFTSTSAGTLVYHIVTSAQASDPTLGTSISSPYTHNTAGTIVVRIYDPGTTSVAAKSLFVSVEVAAQANNLALQATSGNYTIATTGTNADSDTTDGSTFAQAAAVTNSTPITTATAINFTGFTSTSAGTLVYHIVTSAQASDPTLGTSISSPYTHNTAGTIVVRIYDPGTTSVAAKSLFVSVEVAAQANNLALQATSGNYTIATTGTNADSDTTDGSTFAQAAAVTNSTPITTATAINFTGFTSTSAGTLVYHIVTSAQASDPTLGTSISSPYTHNTAGTIVVRIYDSGTTSVAAKSLFVSVEVAAQANNLALQATSGNYTIATTGTNADSDTTDGSTFAQAAAVTNSTPITTATAINFTGFTSTSAGTLVYHIVTSAQASDPTLGTSISSPYTHNTAGTIVVRIYDPGTTSVAAKSLFVSVEVAAQANNLALQATSGNYTIATTGTNADSDTTDGSTFAQAAAVTNSTPITTATAINFTGFTSTSAGTLVYHIVTSAQASDPTLGTSISSPYTHNTAGTIVVRIYDPGTTSVAAKSLFVSVEVASEMVVQDEADRTGVHLVIPMGANADANRIVVHKSDGMDLQPFGASETVPFTSLVKDFNVAADDLSYSTDGGSTNNTGASITIANPPADIDLDITDPGTGVTLYFMIDVVPGS